MTETVVLLVRDQHGEIKAQAVHDRQSAETYADEFRSGGSEAAVVTADFVGHPRQTPSIKG